MRNTALKTERIGALDFTKGALVLIMVLYHWLNYFVSTTADFYRYLRFLTPSFIFVTGFLISHVYLRKYGVDDPRVPRRLITRGVKILAVFVGLNIVRTLLISDSRAPVMPVEAFGLNSLIAAFVTGTVMSDGGGKASSFNILVPIGYLLLLSGGLVTLCRFYKYTFHLVCVVLVACVLLLGINGFENGYLELLTIGLVGVTIGYIPLDAISRCLTYRAAIAVAYLGYIGVITAWGVTYPLQLIGVFVNLMVIYSVAEAADGRAGEHVALLGRYSLFGYIAQIAILQVLHRSVRPVSYGTVLLVSSFIAAFGLTMISVEALERARSKVRIVDRVYKAVFA